MWCTGSFAYSSSSLARLRRDTTWMAAKRRLISSPTSLVLKICWPRDRRRRISFPLPLLMRDRPMHVQWIQFISTGGLGARWILRLFQCLASRA
ncbi:hypothetical protein BS78_02G205300 [Paspalum vaginatum]|nr:hypothetical protein BS78_02G205300 [Paspalum vaginatum]